MKFYKCDLCGKIVAVVKDSATKLSCCGEEMKEIAASKDESSLKEKHVPVFEFRRNRIYIDVGEVLHPTTLAHHIEWIAITTNKGNQRKELEPGDAPRVYFNLDDDEFVEEIYAYCNLHSLWLKKVMSSPDEVDDDCGCSINY